MGKVKNNIINNIDILKSLIESFNGLDYDILKELYPYTDIITIDKLKSYCYNYTKKRPIILLVLNSKFEHSGHYIVLSFKPLLNKILEHNLPNNSPSIRRLKNRFYIYIFDPLGVAGLINMPNCNNDTKDFLLNVSNHEVIQNVESQCCSLLCLLFVYINAFVDCPANKFMNLINQARNENKDSIKFLIKMIEAIINEVS